MKLIERLPDVKFVILFFLFQNIYKNAQYDKKQYYHDKKVFLFRRYKFGVTV